MTSTKRENIAKSEPTTSLLCLLSSRTPFFGSLALIFFLCLLSQLQPLFFLSLQQPPSGFCGLVKGWEGTHLLFLPFSFPFFPLFCGRLGERVVGNAQTTLCDLLSALPDSPSSPSLSCNPLLTLYYNMLQLSFFLKEIQMNIFKTNPDCISSVPRF